MFKKILLINLICLSLSTHAFESKELKISYELNANKIANYGTLTINDREKITSKAHDLLKTKYVYGGRSNKGLDCSGLIIEVFKSIGVIFSGSAKDIAKEGVKIKKEKVLMGEVKAGDLLFFNTTGSPNSHVGIVIDGGKFIHASTSKGKVIISSLKNNYYLKKLEFAKRL